MCTISFKLEDGAGCFFPLCSSFYCPTGGLSKIDPSVPIVSAMQYGLLKYSTVSMPSTLLRMKTVAKTKTGLPFYVYFPCAKLVNKTRNLNCVDQRSRIIKCSIYMKGALMCAYKLHSNQKSPRSVFYGFLAKWTQMLMRTLRSGVM